MDYQHVRIHVQENATHYLPSYSSLGGLQCIFKLSLGCLISLRVIDKFACCLVFFFLFFLPPIHITVSAPCLFVSILCVLNLVVISFFQLMSGLLAASWPKWSEAVCCFQALIVSLPELHCCAICVCFLVQSQSICSSVTSKWMLRMEMNDEHFFFSV